MIGWGISKIRLLCLTDTINFFAVPADGELLLSSPDCRNQAFSYRGNARLAGSCRDDRGVINQLAGPWRSDLLEHIASVQICPAIVAPMVDNITRLNEVAEQLYRRWTATITL